MGFRYAPHSTRKYNIGKWMLFSGINFKKPAQPSVNGQVSSFDRFPTRTLSWMFALAGLLTVALGKQALVLQVWRQLLARVWQS